jgi:hypothetical protein
VVSNLRTAVVLVLALAAASLFLSAVREWPDATLVDAPVRLHVTPRYLERSAVESARMSPDSAVRWDYRAWDLWVWVFAAVAAMAAASGPLRDGKLSRTAVGAVSAAGVAWFLGVLPVFRGGAFLDYQFLPSWVDPARMRFTGSVILEAVFLVVCGVLLFALLLARRGAKKRGGS